VAIFSTKPTVIIVPGYGFNLTPDDYSYIINDLSLRGYTVKKYYPSFNDISNYQKLIEAWSAGIGALSDNKKVIVIGHSVGGAVAMHFCATDRRCVAEVNLDGGPIQNLPIPVPNLYIQGEIGEYCDSSCIAGRKLAELITAESRGNKIFLPNLKHMDFTDFALKPPHSLVIQGYFGSINPKTGFQEIDNEIDSFLHNLKS